MSSESMTSTQQSAVARPTIVIVRWERAALGATLLLAAVLNVFQLDRVGLGNTYYTAAVKSMLTSWHNFFFVSLDPGGFVSVDKPPVAFWIQTASAKLFGFSGLSLLLPEAIAGVLSVALLYHLVARVFGRVAGLLAALALALTPIAVVVDRSNLVESILVLTVLLAAWALTRAPETGRLRWLLLSAALVGLGFNIKMLEAYLVVPALFLVYLLGVRLRWYTRLWHLVLAGVVMLVVSLSWVTAVDLTPVSQRPYVGSSGNNSELSLALGYNGLGRLTGNAFSFLRGGTSLSKTISDLSPTSLGFTQGETGGAGIQRLVNAELGGQASWLLMLAVLGFLVAAWQKRVRLPLDREQQALLLWGVWLLTGAAFFSVAGFFHAYYLVMIAPPIAALAGIGMVTLWRDYRRSSWRGWALPLALLATASVQAHILSYFPDWSRWLTPLVVGSSILVAITLIVMRLGRMATRPIALASAGLGVLALLLAPSVWTEYSIARAAGATVPSAGPMGLGGFGGGGRPAFLVGKSSPFSGRPAGGGGFGPPPGAAGIGGRSRGGGGLGGGDLTTANSKLVKYLEAHQGKTTFLVATLNAGSAESFILATDKPVMDLGGFLGADRILDPKQLAADVRKGTVRYFLLSSRESGGPANLPAQFRRYLRGKLGFQGGLGGGNSNNDLVQWVSSHCRTVPASTYQSSGSSSTGGFGFGGAEQLYECSRARARG